MYRYIIRATESSHQTVTPYADGHHKRSGAGRDGDLDSDTGYGTVLVQ